MDLNHLLALIGPSELLAAGALIVSAYVAVNQRKSATTEEFDKFCGQLQDDNEQLRARLATVEAELAQLRGENSALKVRVKELEDERDRLRAQIEELQKKRARKGQKTERA